MPTIAGNLLVLLCLLFYCFAGFGVYLFGYLSLPLSPPSPLSLALPPSLHLCLSPSLSPSVSLSLSLHLPVSLSVPLILLSPPPLCPSPFLPLLRASSLSCVTPALPLVPPLPFLPLPFPPLPFLPFPSFPAPLTPPRPHPPPRRCVSGDELQDGLPGLRYDACRLPPFPPPHSLYLCECIRMCARVWRLCGACGAPHVPRPHPLRTSRPPSR